MSGNRQLLDKIARLLDQRQADIARMAGRFGVEYSAQRTRQFMDGIQALLANKRLASFDTLKVVASTAVLADDYELIDRLLEFLDRHEGSARSVDAGLVAAGIRAMASDSLMGHMQSALSAGQLEAAIEHLQAAYRYGVPAYDAVQPLIDAVRARDGQRAATLERDYRSRLESAGRGFEDRLAQSAARRQLRELILPVYASLIEAGDLERAEQQLSRLYACDLSDFAPVAALADAYLERDPAPGSAGYRRAEALVARYLHDVGEPLGALASLDAVRYQNAHFAPGNASGK